MTPASEQLPHPAAPGLLAVRDSGFSTPSLDRALAVLECVARHPQGVSQARVAAELGLSANFVYRVAQALAAHGYLVRDASKRFSLGGKLLSLCQPVSDDVPLAEAALPAMRWLSEETGEAAHLGIIDGHQGLVLERVIGRAMIKFYVERGSRFPLHTSAPGKAILAFLPPAERDAVVAGMDFEAYQPWTLASPGEFLACLGRVRDEGYAIDAGEHLEGHHCLGGPVFGAAGIAVASLWITGPSQRLGEERMAALAPVVKEACRMASAALSGNAAPAAPAGALLSLLRTEDAPE